MDAEPGPVPAEVTTRPALRHHFLALFFALLGGVLGILGALIAEFRGGTPLLLPIVGAPIIEEALKPAGLYILLAKWPQALRGRLYTASLAGLSGLSFGVIEALVYVYVYVPDAPQWFVFYRFSVPLVLHTGASFIYGLGIDRGLIDWAARGTPLPKRTRNVYIAAVCLHAAFNTTAVVLWALGYLDVD